MHSDKVSTTASESRKSTKPIMEKRRRARINASLAELKSLLLEVIKKEGARHSKMEKADILEMTVKHLRQIQRQQFSAEATHDPSVINKYRLGFNECATEVSRYLASLDGCDVELRARLLNHLANCMAGVTPTSTDQPSATIGSHQVQADSSLIPIRSPPEVASTSSMSSPPLQMTTKMELQTTDSSDASSISSGSIPSTSPDHPKLFSGVHVIPTKMSTGEIAFVLPTSCFPITSGHVSNYVIPVYASSTQLGKTPPATNIAFPPLSFSANQVCPIPTLQPSISYLSCPIIPISSCLSNATSSPDTVAPDSSTNSLPSTPSTSGSRTHDSPAMEQHPDAPAAEEPTDGDDMWRPWNCSE